MQKLEKYLSSQHIKNNTNKWKNFDYTVINFNLIDNNIEFEFNGFDNFEDAEDFSQDTVCDKYKTKTNLYFLGLYIKNKK